MKSSFLFLCFFLLFDSVFAQSSDSVETEQKISFQNFQDGIHHWYLIDKENRYERYDTNDVIGIANNFVAFQNEDGGWPKNIDWLAIVNADSLKSSLSERNKQSTLDNRNTWPQIEYLAEVYKLTGKPDYRISAEKGIQYLLNTQNRSGGWQGWDVDAITFNDDVMTGVMNLLLDIKYKRDIYSFLSPQLREKSVRALDKAIEVTLGCQILVHGRKTAWGQQHDHESLRSVQARTYELAGITANESVSVIRFLMRLKSPSDTLVDAIEAAVEWLKLSALPNIRIETIDVPKGTYPGSTMTIDRRVIYDSAAPPIWTRYYEIDTNKPFMCTRSGQKVYELKDVNPERRAGYSWYGYWPQALLENDYPAWRLKMEQ